MHGFGNHIIKYQMQVLLNPRTLIPTKINESLILLKTKTLQNTPELVYTDPAANAATKRGAGIHILNHINTFNLYYSE